MEMDSWDRSRDQSILQVYYIDSGEIETLVSLFGGQGTINVNSWAPDSRSFAFVRYQIRFK